MPLSVCYVLVRRIARSRLSRHFRRASIEGVAFVQTAAIPSPLFRFFGRAAALAPSVATVGLLALGIARIARHLGDGASIALLGLAGWLGWIASDLVSGVAHWLCDRYGDERTPVIGPLVIAPFREHHVDPQILARKDFFDAAASNAWLALTVLVPWLAFGPEPQGASATFLAGFAVSLGAGVFLTNTFHQWAHQESPPRAARWLQALRIAIKPERHARHHASGDAAYCVTTGFCNPALDRWRVFERIERATALLGSPPHRKRSHG
jgi:ubiquitin-conjugating enzyme E2 variant